MTGPEILETAYYLIKILIVWSPKFFFTNLEAYLYRIFSKILGVRAECFISPQPAMIL